MNRRGFLTALGLGAAGLVLDPERLLWVPGQRTIFLPPLYPTLSISQIVAATYEQVLREHRGLTGNLWFDSAFVRECERKGILIRGADLNVTLDYLRNEP